MIAVSGEGVRRKVVRMVCSVGAMGMNFWRFVKSSKGKPAWISKSFSHAYTAHVVE